jgi:formate dehydrogenase iron-sulfur subunit
LTRTGTRGLFWLEPLLEIETPSGWKSFGPCREEDVASILDAALNNKNHALSLGAIEEHPFLKRQKRLTFARCGKIDPPRSPSTKQPAV